MKIYIFLRFIWIQQQRHEHYAVNNLSIVQKHHEQCNDKIETMTKKTYQNIGYTRNIQSR